MIKLITNEADRLKAIRNWKYCRHHSQEECERSGCPYKSEVSCEWLLAKDIVSILDADTRELMVLKKYKQSLRDKLKELLMKYFTIGDSYSYNLTRVKEAFAVGTVSVEDFEEFDEEFIDDLVKYIMENMEELK